MDVLRAERAQIGTFDTSKDVTEPSKMASEMGITVVAITSDINKAAIDECFAVGMVEAI